MKKHICCVLILFGALFVNAQEQGADIIEEELLQAEILLDKEVSNGGLYIDQRGNFNESLVDIQGGSGQYGSLISIDQLGDYNLLDFKANSRESDILLLQNGFNNEIFLDLYNDRNSDLKFIQDGNGNTIDNLLRISINSNLEILQQGNEHYLKLETELIEIPAMRITQSGTGAQLILIE
jgi:hypothetical protein